MKVKAFLKEVHRRNVWKVAVAYTAAAAVLLEVLTHLFHNFEAPHWVLKVITTLLIVGLPVACLMAWGFEFKEGRVRSVPWEPRETSETKPALPAPETPAPPSIAVLPFEDMSAEHDQQYLGDGIAEDLLSALASIEGLNVVARTSSFSFAGKGVSMEEIGKTLHVRYVLEGSVRRSGQKLRVTAQLIDVKSGFHRFTQSYDREVQDIFAIQNDIAHEIAGALLPKLGLSKDVMLVRQGTGNLEAYSLRLKAHRALNDPAPEALKTAIEQLQQAIALDPKYGDAWADLSYVFAIMATWADDPLSLIVKAARATTVAQSNPTTTGTSILIAAYVDTLVDYDAASTVSYYAKARAEGVDESLWVFAKVHLYNGPLGLYAEAIPEIRAAERKDPLAASVKWALIQMYLSSGRLPEALEVAEEIDKLDTKVPGAMLLAGLTFVATGDIERALRTLSAMRAMTGEDFPYTLLLQFGIDAATDDRADARATLDRLLGRRAAGQPVLAYVVGEGYKAVGDYDLMFDWWTRAVEQHDPLAFMNIPVRNRNHPVIGKDPRFLALLKRMGLEGEDKGAS